jgi:hypothetical protein
MTTAEFYLLAVAVVGLAIWAHGCAKRAASSCALGLLLGVVAAIAYFAAFSLTRTSYFAALLLAPFLFVLLLFRAWARTTSGKVLAAVVIVLVAAAAITEFKVVSLGNAMLVIEPYRSGTTWRFDEPLLHLKAEPFVQGMPQMIDKMVQGIPGSEKSVRLIFSQRPFPGWQYRLDLTREEDGGNWYYNDKYQMEGWLCPALFKFFPRAPKHIYARAEST